MTKPANRQARRKEKTRALLINATTELLLEGSVDALTVHDITERADVARGTFYVYFETKEDAVWALLASILGDIDAYLKENPLEPDSVERDRARYAKWQVVFEHLAANRAILSALLGERGHISTLRRMEAFIAELMERDLSAGQLVPKGDVPISFVAQYLAGALTRVIVDWLEHPQATSVDEMSTYFFTLARQQFEADV